MKKPNLLNDFGIVKILSITFMFVFSLSANAITWPQAIQTEKGKILVYQPQPEKLEGNTLHGRSAMSIQLKNSEELIFGVLWFKAQIDTDKEAGTALIHNVKAVKVRWPESKKQQQDKLSLIIENWLPKTGFEISLKRLSASLKNAELQLKSLELIKNDPPKIVFKQSISVLLIFDGKPKFTAIKDSEFKRAVNTPFMVASNAKETAFYLSNGSVWYQAKNALGPWIHTSSVPQELEKMVNQATGSSKVEKGKSDALIPEIIVATEPTELIVTSGAPNWSSLTLGKILYVKNTETPWLRELSTNQYFILLSGRWFSSKSTNGPWEFVRSDELPESFADIPPASELGGVRTSVAGTEEAEEAILDSQIPQTAAIKRSEAKLTVKFDGKPDFKLIPDTSVYYAVNTNAQVLRIGSQYYAVDNGVWFTAALAAGPWIVADKIPSEEIAKIPPSSVVYNTTYVHVYHSTPKVVYVGYTPGYMWSFPYYGVPIYGSGWYYPPYYGPHYYHHPATWGMHVGYNSYTGWNYGMTWSNGFLTVGFNWGNSYGGYGCCYGGYYGHGPVIVNRGPVIINNGNINIGNNINAGRRDQISNKLASNPNFDASKFNNKNLYNRVENSSRNVSKQSIQNNFQKARGVTSLPNNVFADRSGNIVRRENNQWQSRSNGQWKNSSTLKTRPINDGYNRSKNKAKRKPSSTSYDRNYTRQRSLNDAYNSRQRGAAREQLQNRSPRKRRR